MEKLFELLQIYVIERQGREQFKLHGDKIILWRPYKLRRFPQYDTNAVIISKRFGFIQRLIGNDKIRKDIYRPIPLRIKATYEDGVVYYDKLYDRIIMLLAIQDNPIEFLISILK